MNRSEKRQAHNAKYKIAKRGPRVDDFTVAFDDNGTPYITLDELEAKLSGEWYKAVEELLNKLPDKELEHEGKSGIFTGDCAMIFARIKELLRLKVISTQHKKK